MNAEFRKRMNQHFSATVLSGKSTKEIAREAVQEEFSKRKRKLYRHGDDGDYLSSGDDDDRKQRPTTNKQKLTSSLLDQTVGDDAVGHKNEMSAVSASAVYRDRARERREGKNVDYLDSQHISQLRSTDHLTHSVFNQAATQNNAAEWNQYLGGDESLTHLVQGLDRQLAHRLRNNEHAEESMDLDRIRPEVLAQNHTSRLEHNIKDLPISTLFTQIQSSTCSHMGKGVFSYLQNVLARQDKKTDWKDVNDSLRHKSIPKTLISFSTHANIHLPGTSWEIPKESIVPRQLYESFTTSQNDSPWRNRWGAGSTPVDMELIQKIKCALQSTKTVTQRRTSTRQENEIRSESIPKRWEEGEDDEDIFSGVGEYIPSTVTTTRKEQEDPETKTVIFETSPSQILNATESASKDVARIQQKQYDLDDEVDKPVGPPWKKVQQVPAQLKHSIAMDSYTGNYGEEMDLDFDGSLEAELQQSTGKGGRRGKAKKQQDVTTAALEYGSRGSRKKSSKDADQDL